MKNINKFFKLISSALAILMIVSAFALVGCADHDDHDHDHEAEVLSAEVAAMYPDVSLLAYPENYPTVSAYPISEVKKETYSSGVLVLRVAKIDGDQYYCTAGKSQVVNFILINPPFEDVAINDFLLLSVKSYQITSERFGFDYGEAYPTFYVVDGSEAASPQKITASAAYQIYSQIPTM